MAQISRRLFIKIAAWVIGLLAILAGGFFLLVRRRPDLLKPEFRASLGELADDEKTYLIALAEVLYPPQNADEQSQLKREVGYWVSARAREDGYLAVYREGVQLLKRATASGAAATFPQLSLPDRDKILRSLVPFGTSSAEWGQIQHPLDLARSFFQRDRLRFRKFVVEDFLKGIYSSAVGWRLVKYDTWPGVPATDYDYTRPPAAIDAN